jgi:hypothetical protein
MAYLAEREFDCLLCAHPFSRYCGDLVLPEDQVCDQCLAGLEHLDSRELWAYIDDSRVDLKEKPNP